MCVWTELLSTQAQKSQRWEFELVRNLWTSSLLSFSAGLGCYLQSEVRWNTYRGGEGFS